MQLPYLIYFAFSPHIPKKKKKKKESAILQISISVGICRTISILVVHVNFSPRLGHVKFAI